MIKFSLIVFWLYVMCVETFHFHGKKMLKCPNTPDTWIKVAAAITACQENVKLSIIKDSYYSNDWNDAIFDDDGHGHKDHLPIIDHSAIYDHKPHIIEDHPPAHDQHSHISDPSAHIDNEHIYEHHPQIHDHHPQINDHHPQVHDHHPQVHDHHPQVHDHHPQINDHHPQVHDHHPQVHDHHPQLHDHHPQINDHHPQVHDHHPQVHDHHPQIRDHNPQVLHQQSLDDHQNFEDHHTSSHDHHQQIDHPQVDDHYPQTLDRHPKAEDHHTPGHDHHQQIHDHYPKIYNYHSQIHDHHPQTLDHHQKVEDHHTPSHYSAKNEHFPTLLSYEALAHRPHGHSLTSQHSHDSLQIEAPQLKKPQPFTHSAHLDSAKNVGRNPGEHIGHSAHTTSMSDNPIEQDHYIDFNEFRKKRHANDHERIHPSTASYHDKRIAGCILQCIYEKNHAVDALGWPTLDGLVNFYSEGVNEHGYFMATLRAVDYCLKGTSAKYHVNRRSTPEKGQTCDVAFDVFDCISDQITEYCSDEHV